MVTEALFLIGFYPLDCRENFDVPCPAAPLRIHKYLFIRIIGQVKIFAF